MRKIASILVATDLTESSGEVVAAAARIAAASGAPLHLLHAFDVPTGSTPVAAPERPSRFTDRIAQAEARLDDQIRQRVPTGVEVGSRRVEIYVAHKAIADAAAAVSADLIVVGAHSHRRMGDELLGGTADRVIRTAESPCLVVRGALRVPLRRVLAPVDRSPAASGALEVAMEWSAALGGGAAGQTTLTVLHVLPEALQIPEFSVDPEDVRGELHAEVEQARARAPAARELQVREEVRWGDSALDEIVRFAGEDQTDLLVTGTHGHGAVKRFLIGSVASGLARRTPCSVLLVPPSMWQGE